MNYQRPSRAEYLRDLYAQVTPRLEQRKPVQFATRSAYFLLRMDDMGTEYEITTRIFSWVPKAILLTLAAALLLTVILVILL